MRLYIINIIILVAIGLTAEAHGSDRQPHDSASASASADTVVATSADTIYSALADTRKSTATGDTLSTTTPDTRKRFWQRLIPSQVVAQNAGNMGLLSLGVGWDYGRARQWETQLLVGFVPKYKSFSAKPTVTLKENFIPWRYQVGRNTRVEPVTCAIYVNTIIGKRFWSHLPSRYPNNYYWFSTRFRINLALGERITWQLPAGKKYRPKAITAFYECSTCDLYLHDYLGNKSIKLRDIVSLSLGLKIQLF